MKKFAKLIPALALLLVSAVLMSTASYAWFSMNNKVAVTGMAVKTQVSNNLLIAPDTLGSVAKLDDSYFVSSLTQAVKGYLAPVSTVDGDAFFYTDADNVKASGDAISDAYISYTTTGLTTATDTTNYSNKFSENSGITKATVQTYTGSAGPAVGYVEYVFQLKAINTGASNIPIKLKTLNLEYTKTGTETDECKAYRVAIFVEDITSAAPAGTVGSLNAIYTTTGSSNFTSGKAVKSTSTLDTVTYVSSETNIASVAQGTHYYKVVVRLWLEGEDTTCNNTTFMALTGEWKLNVELELSSTITGVTGITKTVPTP